LPPRQIACDAAAAAKELQTAIGQTRSFRVQVQEIKVFPVSDVIYISIGAGSQELKDLHSRLNQGPCRCAEIWSFQPHLTLAQDLESDKIAKARELAEQRWREYAGPRDFNLDKLTFVQGNPERGWVDLESIELLSPVLA